jgi:hypothetical protein
LIRHPLIIAPFAAQRQALLTERLLMRRPLLGFSTEQGPLAILGWPIDFATRIWRLLGERWSTMQRDPR